MFIFIKNYPQISLNMNEWIKVYLTRVEEEALRTDLFQHDNHVSVDQCCIMLCCIFNQFLIHGIFYLQKKKLVFAVSFYDDQRKWKIIGFYYRKNKMISRTQILSFFVSNVTFIAFSRKRDTIDQQLSQKKERDNLIYL